MSNSYNEEQKKLTRDSISQALILLAKNKEYNKISVSEVANKAGVSRMAFYRNYDSLEDVVKCQIREINNKYRNSLTEEDVDNFNLTRVYFETLRQEQDFFITIFKSTSAILILSELVEFLESFSEKLVCNIECSPKYRSYNIEFLAGGLFNVIRSWCNGGMIESADEMALLICDRISSHIVGVSI